MLEFSTPPGSATNRQGSISGQAKVPKLSGTVLAEEVARQAALLNNAPDQHELMEFIAAATSDLGLEPYDWGPDGPPPFVQPNKV